MTRDANEKGLAALRRVATQIAKNSQADLSLRLWNGETVPLGAHASGELAIAINSPAAVTRLLRGALGRRRINTLVELIAEGEIDFVGGTLLDIAVSGGEGTRGLGRRLSKFQLARNLLPFLFSSAQSATPKGHGFAGDAEEARPARRDDKALVQFHYDLSNDFYALFLDPEMQYSCAYFPTEETDLAAAQQAKLDMICRKLRMQPDDRFLDIGCGWGGLVIHAAQHFGARAHGITLSEAQLAFVKEKVARLGLQDRVTVELKHFRDLKGEYDRIASIGMFEHVAWDDHEAYFRKMRALLRPRGVMLHHAITRPGRATERQFRRKRAEYAAIVKYIFPGGELDHIGHTLTSMECAGFEVADVEAWREHYARTTKFWCERLYANREAAEHLVGAAKTRIWLLYLSGVSLGFTRGGSGIYQTVATRRARGTSGLPLSRADLYPPR